MTTLQRLAIVLALCLAPSLAHAGGRCGVCNYSYIPSVYSAPVYSAPAVRYAPLKVNTVYPPVGWRESLLQLAKQRDAFEGKRRLVIEDQRAYIEAIQALGLTGNFNWGGYGAFNYGNGIAQSYQLGSYGQSGGSVYGYQTIASQYGAMDINALYQAGARLTQNAQGLAGQGHSDFLDLLRLTGNNQARVAEILAKGQVAVAALQAAPNAAPSQHVETRIFKFRSGPNGLVPLPEDTPAVPQQGQATANLNAFATLAAQRCASCHSGKDARAGFQVGAYPNMSREDKMRVWHRITHPDPAKRMPQGADGKPGVPLTPEEITIFLQN